MSKYDTAWSRIARLSNPWCEVCEKRGEGEERISGLNAHHFIRRSIKPTRLVLENAIILCTSHHVFNHEFSAHKTPESFKKWFKKKHPARAKRLEKKSQQYMNEKQAVIEFLDLIVGSKLYNDFYKILENKRVQKGMVQQLAKKD